MRSEIAMPGSHVTAGAGEQRAAVEGADAARQQQRPFGRTEFRLNKTHRRNRLLIGPGFDLLLAPGAIDDTECGQSDRAHGNETREKYDTARPGGAAGGR